MELITMNTPQKLAKLLQNMFLKQKGNKFCTHFTTAPTVLHGCTLIPFFISAVMVYIFVQARGLLSGSCCPQQVLWLGGRVWHLPQGDWLYTGQQWTMNLKLHWTVSLISMKLNFVLWWKKMKLSCQLPNIIQFWSKHPIFPFLGRNLSMLINTRKIIGLLFIEPEGSHPQKTNKSLTAVKPRERVRS